jgi:mannose-6-phosphate isomerase-like protein (cupin superfamily)
VGPGSLAVVPRGVAHAFERRGKNPLIVLSMLAGAPCPPSVTAVTSSGR